MQILAVHRSARLAHLCVQDHAHRLGSGPHRERHADVANHRSNDVARPAAVSPVRRTPVQPNRRGIHRFLSERAKAFPLKSHGAIFDFAAGEERLQAGVRGSGEQHAPEHLAALVGGQRCFECCAPQERVAGIEQFSVRLRRSRVRGNPWRRLGQSDR